MACRVFRTIISGFVFVLRILDVRTLRFSGVNVSAMGGI